MLDATREVPPFALFELVASQTASASRANNAKSGTCVTDAPSREELAGDSLLKQPHLPQFAGDEVAGPNAEEADGALAGIGAAHEFACCRAN